MQSQIGMLQSGQAQLQPAFLHFVAVLCGFGRQTADSEKEAEFVAELHSACIPAVTQRLLAELTRIVETPSDDSKQATSKCNFIPHALFVLEVVNAAVTLSDTLAAKLVFFMLPLLTQRVDGCCH